MFYVDMEVFELSLFDIFELCKKFFIFSFEVIDFDVEHVDFSIGSFLGFINSMASNLQFFWQVCISYLKRLRIPYDNSNQAFHDFENFEFAVTRNPYIFVIFHLEQVVVVLSDEY